MPKIVGGGAVVAALQAVRHGFWRDSSKHRVSVGKTAA
jgi:hypothetical protein